MSVRFIPSLIGRSNHIVYYRGEVEEEEEEPSHNRPESQLERQQKVSSMDAVQPAYSGPAGYEYFEDEPAI